MNLVYKNEKRLFPLMLGLSVLGWIVLLLATAGVVLVYALLFFVIYCFAQSALIAYLKGNAVRITEEQFPDLKRQVAACCAKLGMADEPEAYLLQMGGALNAFATRFFGRDFLVLYSDVVDGLADQPDALNFYIGHEIGHIKRKHLVWSTVLMPAMMLPLAGAAYSRAREYTCDRHGLAACANANSAELGMAVLAAGGKRAHTMNTSAFIDQARESEGFWMSFHELVGDYPWLAKRMAALRAMATGQELRQPRRHPLAGVLAIFVPRVGAGGGAGAIVTVAMIGVLAAVGIPAYQGYLQKAKVLQVYEAGRSATAKVEAYIGAHGTVPQTLEEAGLAGTSPVADIERVQLNSNTAEVRLITRIRSVHGQGVMTFTPSMDEGKRITWRCSADDINPQWLPAGCR